MKKFFYVLLAIMLPTLPAWSMKSSLRLLKEAGELWLKSASKRVSKDGSYATIGYNPPTTPTFSREEIALPRNVRFLNEDCTLFEIVGKDDERTVVRKAPKVVQENDHSLRVELEKN
ncbi:MAG: hypothetical protein HOI80_01985 [Alphaproteobacteria bacterium]|jgi:hypothetical protein|nr:hypothetical protein [Alphaproteobacteria bacterium]MBT5390601.1 hypothetical protein [Alphaproteobacteria bacterium]MBT5540341.1 hypothetical protein [Alphaproteobacteria bacterium]MBT5654255.1 hypothetical protein [Alphaproteobacteria bacterium]